MDNNVLKNTGAKPPLTLQKTDENETQEDDKQEDCDNRTDKEDSPIFAPDKTKIELPVPGILT